MVVVACYDGVLLVLQARSVFVLLCAGSEALRFVVHVITRKFDGVCVRLSEWERLVPWAVPTEASTILVWLMRLSPCFGLLMSLLLPVDSRDLPRCYLVHFFDIFALKICPCVGFDLGYAAPFVHSEFAYTDLDIQSVVVLRVDIAVREVLSQHLLVRFFAAFQFRNKSSPGFGELAHAATQEFLPPLMLPVVGTRGPSSGADAHKHSDFSAWPLVLNRFVQDGGRRIVLSRTLVQIPGLANLDWLEGHLRCARRSSGFPDLAIDVGCGLSPRIVGAEQCGDGCAFQDCSHSSLGARFSRVVEQRIRVAEDGAREGSSRPVCRTHAHVSRPVAARARLPSGKC